MATKQKIETKEIKTDGVAIVQRNYLEKKLAREKAEERQLELAVRDACATEYRLDCKRRRKQAIKDRLYAIGAGVICAGLMFTLIACYKPTTSTPTETEPSRPMSCRVVETRGNLITVECRGSLYAFYGDGFSEGEMITCYFTDNEKIIKAEK